MFSHTRDPKEGPDEDEGTSESPILGTEQTEDALPVTLVGQKTIPSGEDLEDGVQTVLLDCEKRMREVDGVLRQLSELLEGEISASEGDAPKIQMLGEIKRIVISAINCFPAVSSGTWEDSDPRMCALSLPAITFGPDGTPVTPVPKEKKAPVEIMQEALSILEPLFRMLEDAVEIQSTSITEGQPVTCLQQIYLAVKQAVTLLQIC